MSYLPTTPPAPGIDDRPFWDFCSVRELRFQRCAACGRFRHPPSPCCPKCRSDASEWVPAGDSGILYSYSVVHHGVTPALRARGPYNIAIVAFPQCGGVRLVSNVVDAAEGELRIGSTVHLVWDPAETGLPLPRFALRR